MFDEIPHSEKVLKRHQNSDDPCIMAWDHYTCFGLTYEARVATLIEHPAAIWQ